ncbi:MAG TPA: MupG family TIM beta-alpha barrel fold protein [Bacillota bacterium]
MLGISIYLGEKSVIKQKSYIEKMARIGCSLLFTSLHIPEEDSTVYCRQLKRLGQLAMQFDMSLIVDVSSTFTDLFENVSEMADQLMGWGVTGVRIDYGIDVDVIVKLSHQMNIALNASTLTEASLKQLKEEGLNIDATEAWHNFYPRPETGLSWHNFRSKNQWLHTEGLPVAAFIPGDGQLRGPLFEKLPTVENHRHLSTFAALMEMQSMGCVNYVLIGDISINHFSFRQLKSYMNEEILLRAVPCEGVRSEWMKQVARVHTNRADCAQDCLRSIQSRKDAMNHKNTIPPDNCVERPLGTITVDNEHYLRYQGEVQITLTDLSQDHRVNVLGRVIPEDRPLLRWIKGNQNFRIDWLTKDQ